jgi:hypothetical protein
MTKGLIDSRDEVPFDFDLLVHNYGYHCTEPLYLENQLLMVSPVIKESAPTVMSIRRAYDEYEWIAILSTILFLIIFNTIITKNMNKENIINRLCLSLWSYYQPLIGKGEPRKPMNFVYLFWLIGVIPLVEIFKNDLLANLVSIPDVYTNNIDDLLDYNRKTFMHRDDIYNFRGLKIVQDTKLQEKLRRLAEKSDEIEMDSVLKLRDSPKYLKHFSFIEDEYSIKWIHGFFVKIGGRFHIGNEKYLPKLISALCFGPNFTNTHLANKL